MDKHDEYRRHAEYALSQAETADDEHDRDVWMWVAKGWLGLLPSRQLSEDAAFDAALAARWTGQEVPETLQ